MSQVQILSSRQSLHSRIESHMKGNKCPRFPVKGDHWNETIRICCFDACGIVFALNLKTNQESIVHQFAASQDGCFPVGELIRVGVNFTARPSLAVQATAVRCSLLTQRLGVKQSFIPLPMRTATATSRMPLSTLLASPATVDCIKGLVNGDPATAKSVRAGRSTNGKFKLPARRHSRCARGLMDKARVF